MRLELAPTMQNLPEGHPGTGLPTLTKEVRKEIGTLILIY
jgi:hypothetical protein